jgi:hypothetical protein
MRYGRKVSHFLALGVRYPWHYDYRNLIFGDLSFYPFVPRTSYHWWFVKLPHQLVCLAKLHTPEVPPIQIHYVKYLAMSLVWPDRFYDLPEVTRARYERLFIVCARDP